MDSSKMTNFAGWKKWCSSTVEDAPRTPGVYVFRLAGEQAFRRLKGESDLLYIGSTIKGKRTVRDRLKDHLSPGKLARNIGYRLRRVRQEVSPIEVSWKTFDSHAEAKNQERMLLASYEKDHIEFPPLNRQEAGKKVRQGIELVEQVPSSQQKELFAKILTQQE